MRGVGVQGFRAAATLALIGVGRDQAILSRRFRAPEAAELMRWRLVRDSLGAASRAPLGSIAP